MKKKRTRLRQLKGFAMMDVLLAVILIAIASYATFKIAQNFRLSSSVKQVEQLALSITQSYTPYLADSTEASDTSVINTSNEMLVDFLTSIAVPVDDITSSGDYSYVNTGLSAGPCMNFYKSVADDTDGYYSANYLIIGFVAQPAQVNQISQDLGGTFSVFHDSGTLSDNASTGLVDADGSSNYSVYLIYPKTGTTLPTTYEITAPTAC